MGYREHKRKRKEVRPEYVPYRWVQVSGNLQRDAEYVVSLRTYEERAHEIWRLGFHHGPAYQQQLKRRVKELWDTRHAVWERNAQRLREFLGETAKGE